MVDFGDPKETFGNPKKIPDPQFELKDKLLLITVA